MIRARVSATPLFALALFSCRPADQPRPPRARVDYATAAAVHVPPAAQGRLLPGAPYRGDLDRPETLLGFSIGDRPARHAQLLACLRRWAEQSPRMQLATDGQSHEGRDLVHAIISSERNLARLDEIKAQIGKLADPRGLSDAEARQFVEETPAIAWLGYSVHGDELSGADASIAVAYHLLAAPDEEIAALLDQVVVVLVPALNPDGRERFLNQLAELGSRVPNLDMRSMHRGRWPWGRGNHYLFDLNRDWIIGAHPETRSRWELMLEYPPQLVVDAHEMWATDTFLFSPAREPINPNLPDHVDRWQRVFAQNHAAAFDARGWTYYTRDWHEAWYPGYGSEWAAYGGAIGILYEQASVDGQPVRRPSGRIATHRETVEAQAVSSMSDLHTLRAHRGEVLGDYLRSRRAALQQPPGLAFALRPGRVPDRERALLRTLLRQGVEIYRVDEAFSAFDALGTLGKSDAPQKFPVGTYLAPAAQPHGRLLHAMLDLDPRLSEEVLEDERRELERKGRSKIYDVTAWDLARAFDLDGWWIGAPSVRRSPLTELPTPAGEVVQPEGETPSAWVVDGRDDASVTFAVQAIEAGLKVHVGERPFTAAGQSFVRGSVLIRRQDNPGEVAGKIAEAARLAGVQVVAAPTSLSPDQGPDLGGHRFKLLHRPRVAVLSNAPLWPTGFGHVWHQLDTSLRVPFTVVDLHALRWHDLRRYNVIIVPPAWQSLGPLLQPVAKQLAAWVRAGGTLIGLGTAAADLTAETFDLGTVRLRRDVLLELAGFAEAARRDIAAREIDLDPAVIWGERQAPEPIVQKKDEGKKAATPGGAGGPEEAKMAAERLDAYRRLFSPQGAFLRGLVDVEHWLTFGCTDQMPVMFRGDHALMARRPAQVPVRFSAAGELRLAGLLWPEARDRLATTAYVTVEPIDNGQVILFAYEPGLRASLRGTMRLLANAVIYGPGLGARQPLEW